jgi:hypothetical protein
LLIPQILPIFDFHIFFSLIDISLNIAVHVNRVGSFEEVVKGKLSHIIVIILPNAPNFIEISPKFVDLVQDIDIAGVNVKEELFGFVDIGIEARPSLFRPIRRKGQTIHHPRQPVQLYIILIDIE